MSDLQWALLGSSVVAIACVWIYNLWQERKFRQATDNLFKGASESALVDAAGEPSSFASSGIDRQRIEPGAGDDADGTADDLDESAITVNQYAPWADEASDCLIRFDVASAVAAPSIWAAQSTWGRELSKSLRYLARGNDAEAWQLILENDTGRYMHWLAALQLADRNGAISDRELLVFFDGMQQLGTQLESVINLPSRTETLLRAQQLDEFCAGVDVQFSLQVVDAQGGSFAGTKLRGVCEAAGLALQDDGGFYAFDALGATEYCVKNSGVETFTPDNLRSLATNSLTLSLDVPRVVDGVGAFDRMIGTARQIERGLGGKLVDAQRAALADELILGIRTKIAELQKVMHGAGMPPGGPLANKLFSG